MNVPPVSATYLPCCPSLVMEGMKRNAIIVGVIVLGAAIGGALFLLYPEMMFKGTGFRNQGGLPGSSPQAITNGSTTTAGSSNGGYGATP